MTFDLSGLHPQLQKIIKQALKERGAILNATSREVKDLVIDSVDDIARKVKKGVTGEALTNLISDVRRTYADGLDEIITTGIVGMTAAGMGIGGKVLRDYYEKFGNPLFRIVDEYYDSRIIDYANSLKTKVLTGKTLTLSERIWDLSGDNMSQIQKIINAGYGTNAIDVAKALSVYVREGRETFVAQYPHMYARLGGRAPKSLNYEALRLARNELSEDYHNASIEGYKGNEAIVGAKWLLSNNRPEGFHDICDRYAMEDLYGLGPGVYPIEYLPKRHILCLCCISPQVRKDVYA